ncbi:MAG TPA: hypothetical protein VI385_16730 [Flavisolibacter sp.]
MSKVQVFYRVLLMSPKGKTSSFISMLSLNQGWYSQPNLKDTRQRLFSI